LYRFVKVRFANSDSAAPGRFISDPVAQKVTWLGHSAWSGCGLEDDAVALAFEGVENTPLGAVHSSLGQIPPREFAAAWQLTRTPEAKSTTSKRSSFWGQVPSLCPSVHECPGNRVRYTQSKRTGWGTITRGSGSVQVYDKDGNRIGSGVLPTQGMKR
jgi:hypothetical protein